MTQQTRIQQETTTALECELLQAKHEQTRLENNARAFSLRAHLARQAGRDDDARDNEGQVAYWTRKGDYQACYVREIEHEISRRVAGTV